MGLCVVVKKLCCVLWKAVSYETLKKCKISGSIDGLSFRVRSRNVLNMTISLHSNLLGVATKPAFSFVRYHSLR